MRCQLIGEEIEGKVDGVNEWDTSELPPGWAETTLGAVQMDLARGVNPALTPDAMFELYSVPSHEHGMPEITPGSTIGSNKRTVESGTVLLCKINPRINRVWVTGAHSDYPKVASTEWIPFFPLSQIEPRYLAWFLRQDIVRDYAAGNASGVGGSLMRVRAETFRHFRFPLAPASEQTRIADTLEELFSDLDAGVAALERTQEQLKLYRASVLKAAVEGSLTAEVRRRNPPAEPAEEFLKRILVERRRRWEKDQIRKFKEKGKTPPKNWKTRYKEPVAPDTADLPPLPEGWCWGSLDQLGKLDRGRSRHRPRNAEFLYGGPYPFVQTGDIRGADRYLRQHTQTYSEEGLKQSRLWPTETLCITIAANIAETAILAYPACFPDSIVGVLFDPSLVSVQYVELFVQSARDQISVYAPATAQKNINNRILRTLALPLPSFAEQLAIVEAVEGQFSNIDRLEADIEAKLHGAQSLRQAILKHAFSGKLVPQDPNDEPASTLLERIASERQARERSAAAAKRSARAGGKTRRRGRSRTSQRRGGIDFEKLETDRRRLGTKGDEERWPKECDDPTFSRQVLGLEEEE